MPALTSRCRLSRTWNIPRLVALGGGLALIVAFAGDASARPRLDPRLRSFKTHLDDEAGYGRSPQEAMNRAGGLPAGVRVLADGSGNLGIDCLMRLDEGGFEELRRHGITPRTRSGPFVTITLTPEELAIVSGLDGVRDVELSRPLTPYLDISGPTIRSNDVHGGPGPLFSGTGFTGRNVVIGIIDTGIDVTHEDFKRPDGTTRIERIWDQTSDAGLPPQGFGSGTEWTAAQINAGTAQAGDNSGHGTHVAGIAAGDGSDTGNLQPANQYVGIAPEADIIVVETTFFTDNVIDAIDYIFSRAGSRDAVINLSLGTQDGPHDGTSLFDMMIENRLGPGRIIVAAAGNESNEAVHARQSMNAGADSLVFTFQIGNYTPSPGASNDVVYLDGWFEGTDNFKFVIESPSGWRSREIVNNDRLITCVPGTGGEGRLYVENNFLQGGPGPANGDREIYVEITDISNTCGAPEPGIWKIVARRNGVVAPPGHIDLWVAGASLGNNQSAYPRFLSGVSNSHLVGSPASAPGVLSTGAYLTRRSWTIIGPAGRQYQNITDADLGKVTSFSSPGPLRNGDIAPTLVAPGMGIAAARSFQAPNNPDLTLQDGRHVINQGTSQASPHLAGAAALLLERCPHLAPADLFRRFTESAHRDANTGSEPNNVYGYGKLDVRAALALDSPTLACAINGVSVTDPGALLTYTDDTVDARNRRWSVTSSPAGIATIVGGDDDQTVQIRFTGDGTCVLSLSVSDADDPDGCRTVCQMNVMIGTSSSYFSVLEALPEAGKVRLHWELRDDSPEVLGFHLSRGPASNGPFERITDSLLESEDGRFEYVDADVIPGQEYWYILEAMTPESTLEQFGPLFAVPLGVQLNLAQNGPNPFPSTTRIRYSLPVAAEVSLRIYDLGGRLVQTLLDGPAGPGDGEATWDGTDSHGQPAPDGIYFYRLTAGSENRTRKMMLLRR